MRRPDCRRQWDGSPWPFPARHGVAATLGALVILSGAGQVLGASAPGAVPAVTIAKQEEEPTQAPPLASHRAASSTTAEVLERQGVEGFESLLAVAAFDIDNPYPAPVNVEATRAAEAQAAATQTAVAEAAAAATAEATQAAAAATQAAAAATATAAAREAAAAATATAAAQQAAAAATAEAQQAAVAATATAVAVELRNTQATATAEARPELMAAVRATREAGFPTPAPVAAPAPAQERADLGMDRVSLVSLALLPVLGGALGIRLWQRRKEPFVIKAKPVKG